MSEEKRIVSLEVEKIKKVVENISSDENEANDSEKHVVKKGFKYQLIIKISMVGRRNVEVFLTSITHNTFFVVIKFLNLSLII